MHLSPSNYTLRFNLGVVMQKFSASLLNKEKRSADEVIYDAYLVIGLCSFFRMSFTDGSTNVKLPSKY